VSDCLKFEKNRIRHNFLALRNKIDTDTALSYSANIFAKVQKFSTYNNAKIVMFYLSYGSEVVTDNMINSAIHNNKTVVVPALDTSKNEKIYAVKILKLNDASELIYGIRQPKIVMTNVIERNNIDLIFVPGIAFDISGYRIGYGKGCYDRWLEKLSLKKTMGLAYDFQITNKLPNEKYDVQLGTIVTEKRIICN
jgi:5-formyltetrahydrofolate cyclo-ligase